MLPTASLPGVQTAAKPPDSRYAKLQEAAEKLEAQFLAEMLQCAGLGETKGPFTGGPGEQQFASFLCDAQAEEMVRAGGIGLAEQLFESLKEKMDDAG